MKFKLISNFSPTGDQPQAIKKLSENIGNNTRHQVLLGVTGSGKTFTLANLIEKVQKPTLVISHNKTLAAQLYQEFRDFFPNNAVCYFVSYYDYYQPEAYIPQTDTYIEKETEINEEIDKLRLSATANLLARNDVIVVASVSCIYNLGSPVEYGKFILEARKGMRASLRSLVLRLADLQYERNEYTVKRGVFRVRGSSIDLFPSYSDFGLRLETKEDFLTGIQEFDPLTGNTIASPQASVIYPAKHYMTDPKTYGQVFKEIKKDLKNRVLELRNQGKELEAHRLIQRTNFDLQMIREVGYVNGIENYSRYFEGRNPGEPPYTLLDYFDQGRPSKDWLCIIDESHISLPQIRGMYRGDRARKEVLIDYGFRLASALDNRPLKFEEFNRKMPQFIYVSATPSDYELSLAKEYKNGVVQQLIRPTGLIDPKITIKPAKGQINGLISEIKKRAKKKERTLVTTLTKRMAEDLSSFLEAKGLKISYLHSDIATLDRQDVLDKLRLGDYDVIVGINLLREGLDLPEVSLVAILDADKEGFLRSKTSLIQTMGRAARHINAEVILYADNITSSMSRAIKEVKRRRAIQIAYNKKHNIKPKGIKKEIRAKLVEKEEVEDKDLDVLLSLSSKEVMLADEKEILIRKLTSEMRKSARELDFEKAARIRDRIRILKEDY
ncbi:MAG: excinuclease ABC subunit B [Candidatus Levybacteria bacterium RIFCSPLOWO2_01_FULL_38_13]|nr:MAG: excinuclease ABC subunit B [Candidatus Levybacteria bacterium RIFCSPHIGHO2_01_FULL_41_15]OGH35321.1 MAG: excinuclease ABC subunit B [Candidatus Levybacteria bacterium RIFCSPLOWO2_01_FULL_38_13]